MKRRNSYVQSTFFLFLVTQILVALLMSPKDGLAASVTLSWDPAPDSDTAGYRVYYLADTVAAQTDGTAPQWSAPVDVANVTTATITDLDPTNSYFFAVTAYNGEGAESSYSQVLDVADIEPPQVTVSAPSSATGTVLITASASDNVGVAGVDFLVNNVLQSTVSAAPYSFSWNTSSVAAGTYTVTARAYDAAGNVGSASTGIVVGGDSVAPTVQLTAPGSGATVNGSVTVTATAQDNVGVARVEVYDNGAMIFSTNQNPASFAWDTRTAANGSHTLLGKAYDAAGNVGQSGNVTVNVYNDTTAPTITFLSPASTYLYSNKVTVSASAQDDVKVARMDLYVDGTLSTSTTSSSFSTTVNLNKGGHTLTVKATDSSNNVASCSMTVNRFF